MKYERKQIKNLLPHREPMLLLDTVELVESVNEDGENIKNSVATYHVKGDEYFLQGHFPDNPVVPGVILCEMMAQSCCVLVDDNQDKNVLTFLTGLNNVKFKNPVRPGDTIEMTCKITKRARIFLFAEGTATVNGKICMMGEFSFALVPNNNIK